MSHKRRCPNDSHPHQYAPYKNPLGDSLSFLRVVEPWEGLPGHRPIQELAKWLPSFLKVHDQKLLRWDNSFDHFIMDFNEIYSISHMVSFHRTIILS